VQGFGFQWAWELAQAEEETLSYMRQELTWLKNTAVIPAESWRLFAFYIPRSLVTKEGWSDATIKEHIRSSASRAGVALHKITVMAMDSTTNGTKWMTVGAFGENRWYGLTPQELFNRTKIVNAVAGQAAGAEMEEMLDDLDIEIATICSYAGNYDTKTDAECDEQFEVFKKQIDQANVIDAKYIRVNPTYVGYKRVPTDD